MLFEANLDHFLLYRDNLEGPYYRQGPFRQPTRTQRVTSCSRRNKKRPRSTSKSNANLLDQIEFE